MKIGCPDGDGHGPNSKHREPVECVICVDLSVSALQFALAKVLANGEVITGIDCSPYSFEGTPYRNLLEQYAWVLGWKVTLGIDENLADGGWMVYAAPKADNE